MHWHGDGVDLVLYVALPMTGFALAMWQRSRASFGQRREPQWDEDVDIAVAVAVHEASSRNEKAQPIHLLYGLLQDATIIAAIARAGADSAEIEDAVLEALEGDEERNAAQAGRTQWSFEARMILGTAIMTAGERRPGVTDLWSALQKDAQAKMLFEGTGIRTADVLFALIHETMQEAPTQGSAVELIMVNDDVTIQALVVEILQDYFDLNEDDAIGVMTKTHVEGEASLGQFSAAVARTKLADAHDWARFHGSPLLIRWRARPN